MLVSSCLEENIIAIFSFISCDTVCKHDLIAIANMWLAIFADVGVMVLAVLNAIRALNVHRL